MMDHAVPTKLITSMYETLIVTFFFSLTTFILQDFCVWITVGKIADEFGQCVKSGKYINYLKSFDTIKAKKIYFNAYCYYLTMENTFQQMVPPARSWSKHVFSDLFRIR